jgi:hypothetical protein
MSKEKEPNNTKEGKTSSSFGLPEPIHDRREYEEQMAALPPDERSLAEALTANANLCQYFEEHDIDIPPVLVRALHAAASLHLPERTAAIQKINQALMEYLHNVSDDSGIRM